MGAKITPDLEFQEMFYKQVAARVGIAEGLLAGLHHAEFRSMYEMKLRQLLLEINAMVLASKGGPTQTITKTSTTTFRFTAPKKPWWITKKRWAKWPCMVVEVPRDLTVKVECTPEYVYPDCSQVFPKEDRVIRMVTMQSPMAFWKDQM